MSHTAVISSSASSTFRFTPVTKSSTGTRRVPRTDAHSTSAPSTHERRERVTGRRRSAEVAADRAAVANLRRTDRARRLGERGQHAAQLSVLDLGIGKAGAEPERAAVAGEAAELSHLVQVQHLAGRSRSKLSATITSVPPWIGLAPGWSALRRSASSSVVGVRTSTERRVRFSHHGRSPFSPPLRAFVGLWRVARRSWQGRRESR